MMNLGLAVDFNIQEVQNLFNFPLGRKEQIDADSGLTFVWMVLP